MRGRVIEASITGEQRLRMFSCPSASLANGRWHDGCVEYKWHADDDVC